MDTLVSLPLKDATSFSVLQQDIDHGDSLIASRTHAIIRINKTDGRMEVLAGQPDKEGYRENQGQLAQFKYIDGILQTCRPDSFRLGEPLPSAG